MAIPPEDQGTRMLAASEPLLQDFALKEGAPSEKRRASGPEEEAAAREPHQLQLGRREPLAEVSPGGLEAVCLGYIA